jgi:hypothetical protein
MHLYHCYLIFLSERRRILSTLFHEAALFVHLHRCLGKKSASVKGSAIIILFIFLNQACSPLRLKRRTDCRNYR